MGSPITMGPPIDLHSPEHLELGRHGVAALGPELEALMATPDPLMSPRSAQETLDFILAMAGDRLLGAVDFNQLHELFRTRSLGDFESLHSQIMDYIPENWTEARLDPEVVVRAMQATGIPLAHVPRADILREVMKQATRDGALEVLISHEQDILRDCFLVIDALPFEMGEVDLSLAREAVQTCMAGYPSAGMSLGVTVMETALAVVPGTGYKTTHNGVRRAFGSYFSADVLSHVRPWASFHPIQGLYKEWRRGDALVIGPSRHQASHLAIPEVYGRLNSLLTMMSLASVLHGILNYSAAFGSVWSTYLDALKTEEGAKRSAKVAAAALEQKIRQENHRQRQSLMARASRNRTQARLGIIDDP